MSTAAVTPLLSGRFVRLDYTWSYQGAPQEGSLLVGFDKKADRLTAYWIDSWHMGSQGMLCTGQLAGSALSVRGSYAVSSSPDWGWSIAVTPTDGQMLGITMMNISPEGTEYPAVEANYQRE